MTGSLVEKTSDERFEFLVQLCKLEVTFIKINLDHLKIWCFIFILRVRQVGVTLLQIFQLGIERGEHPGHIIDVFCWLLYDSSATGTPCALFIIVFIFFILCAMRLRMSFLNTLVAFLVLPVLLVITFMIPASLFASAFPPISFIDISLCERAVPRMQTFLVQISFCICPEDVGFEDGNWGIGYLRWWIHYIDPPSILCDGYHSVLIAIRKGSTLQSLFSRILSDLAFMSQNPLNVTLVPHIPQVLYVVRSLQWTWKHQPLYWSAHTAVDWSLSLGEMCRRQVIGSIRLQIDTGILYVPIPFSQFTVAGQGGCMKCLWHSKLCPASYYI